MSGGTRTLYTLRLTRRISWYTVQTWMDPFPGGMLGCKVSFTQPFRPLHYPPQRSSSSYGLGGLRQLMRVSSQLKRGRIQGYHLSPISQMMTSHSGLLTQNMLSVAVTSFQPLNLGELLTSFPPLLQGIELGIGEPSALTGRFAVTLLLL